MPLPRFSTSKFRNAVPHVPAREEWYRSSLPSAPATSTSSALSTFTSELKTTREWIVTVTPSGDCSYRPYEPSGQVRTAKVGPGTVGDWDVSRLEGGLLAVGGTDGSVHVYALPRPADGGELKQLHTIPGSSPISHVVFHPTTPDLLLVSSPAAPGAVYDLSSTSAPALNLEGTEPKGLWSICWSPDGRSIAGAGKSGTVYIWNPRSGGMPTLSRSMTLLSPLKPMKLVWVGEHLFLTAFSKTRQRECHVLSIIDLKTAHTGSLDTSTAPLVPVVDQERKIVYLSAKGDMTLRQVELISPVSETVHPLPHTLSSASLALAWPGVLEVMQAEIARLLLLVVDKDGETILPLSIKVPRRQLIDFHDDLYPDITGTVPEQSAVEWLQGGDKMPLPISLDPSRRGVWEKALASAPSATQPRAAAPPPEAIPGASSRAPVQDSHSVAPPSPANPAPSPDLPPLAEGESYASTSYKVRIIGDHIASQLSGPRAHPERPLMVGLQGPQGCGKTTLCDSLVANLSERGLRSAVLSLDDLYKTNAGLKAVARDNPNIALLAGRGPPGTHDADLAKEVLSTVASINNEKGKKVELPIFDKSLCEGEGDRSAETISVSGPLDVFVLEGWSMGFTALSSDELKAAYEAPAPAPPATAYHKQHPLSDLMTLNGYLRDFGSQVYPSFEVMVAVEPTDYANVFKWRLQQEHHMKSKNGGKGMTDEQVHKFVERYMPGYELWRDGVVKDSTPWAGRVLRLLYGPEREVIRIEKPAASASRPAAAVSTQQPAATAPKAEQSTPANVDTPSPRPLPVPETPVKPTPITSSTTQLSADGGKPNLNWSRKFLAAKSPLIPTYDQVPPLSTLHQDSLVLKITPQLAFFPVQGPGGRLGVHPLKKTGRMATGGEGYLSNGVEIVDFAVEPFASPAGTRVAIAGEDGVIKVWTIGEDGVRGTGPAADMTLKGHAIDKIVSIAFHPTASDLLSVSSNDAGKSVLHLFDLSKQSEVKSIVLPSASGIFNSVWLPSGDKLALATKTGEVVVVDPRAPENPLRGKAHDSPRSFQLAWLDGQHLVSVGFGKGSARKINLYALSTHGIDTLYSLTVDISPSVLFPVYDPDTGILYVWGKGERAIQAYEVCPDVSGEKIIKLPTFTAGSPQLGIGFFPKRCVDVKKVEIAKCLRLTARSIEEVSFTIPRNKPDFFQDDIYVLTLDSKTPSITAQEWLDGADVKLRFRDLRPEGMTPLSEAPKTTTPAKKKFVPAANIMSEEEKKKQEMDRLFQKAKADESSDDEPVQSGLAPPDDDW